MKRPPFESIPLAKGLALRMRDNLRVEEKLDGVWHIREVGNSTLIGELMRDGRFFAFDVIRIDGQDIRRTPLRERLQVLDGLSVLRPATGNGGEFLRTVLARGGEGIVVKDLNSFFGAPWYKCKRVETFDLICTELHPERASIHLADANGTDRGWCPCFNQDVRRGDVVEVAAFSLHPSGKLREPRFVRVRKDKIL